MDEEMRRKLEEIRAMLEKKPKPEKGTVLGYEIVDDAPNADAEGPPIILGGPLDKPRQKGHKLSTG